MVNLFCLSRTYILNRWIRGMTKCPGSDPIRETHCHFCEVYEPEKPEESNEDDAVILESEEATW